MTTVRPAQSQRYGHPGTPVRAPSGVRQGPQKYPAGHDPCAVPSRSKNDRSTQVLTQKPL